MLRRNIEASIQRITELVRALNYESSNSQMLKGDFDKMASKSDLQLRSTPRNSGVINSQDQ
jgi:hypothetical protein